MLKQLKIALPVIAAAMLCGAPVIQAASTSPAPRGEVKEQPKHMDKKADKKQSAKSEPKQVDKQSARVEPKKADKQADPKPQPKQP